MAEKITEELLADLRKVVIGRLSEKRAHHTLCVEKMVETLSLLLCPEERMTLRAAALLHDITKEKNTEEQEALCRRYGIPYAEEMHFSPKTYHAMTAAAMISEEFPDFANPTVISAVRWHTTGHKDMTLPEKLLYLADYIDDSREFENCVLLRHFFFDAEPDKMEIGQRMKLLNETLILSYRMTVRELLEKGAPIARETVDAMNDLLVEPLKEKEKN